MFNFICQKGFFHCIPDLCLEFCQVNFASRFEILEKIESSTKLKIPFIWPLACDSVKYENEKLLIASGELS